MKTVLITGAVKNTGLDMAKLFAKRGWRTVITSRDGKKAQDAADLIKKEYGTDSFGFGYEIGDLHYAKILKEKVYEVCDRVDCVILNSASQGLNTDPLTVDIDEWASVINTNICGNFSCAREFAREMVNKNINGTIVFLGSITYRNCNVLRSSYNTSKGGILSMTKALAIDLGKYGIRVNCLMPGPIHTNRYDVLDEETRNHRDSVVPIKRVSTGHDIAKAAYFLASDESGNMTGSGLIIDGGVDSMNGGGY